MSLGPEPRGPSEESTPDDARANSIEILFLKMVTIIAAISAGTGSISIVYEVVRSATGLETLNSSSMEAVLFATLIAFECLKEALPSYLLRRDIDEQNNSPTLPLSLLRASSEQSELDGIGLEYPIGDPPPEDLPGIN